MKEVFRQKPELLIFLFSLILLVLVTSVVYWNTLAPTVTSEDSGELITAAYFLGIPHGPGFPLWCLLGKIFTFLPVKSVAFRVNLMSAFFALLTVVFIYLIVFRLTRNSLSAFIAGIGLAFSLRFWSQAVIAEVYSLNTFILVLGIYILLVWQEQKILKYLLYFALVYGLAQTNHYMLSLLFLPAYLEFFHREDRDLYSKWKTIALLLGVFLCCQLLYLYLPIRSKANPPIDWGNPENLSNFLYHVMRKQAESVDFGRPFSAVSHLRFLLHFLRELSFQFTFLLLPFGLIGLFSLHRKNKAFFALSTLIFLINSIGLNLILQFRFAHENILRVKPYYLPCYCIFAVWIGIGISRSLSSLSRYFSSWPDMPPRTARSLASAFLLILAFVPLFLHYSINDQSENFLAHNLAQDVLKLLDKNAIVFPSGDFITFPLTYFTEVEGQRKDVLIADKTGFLVEEVQQIYARIKEAPRKATRDLIAQWIIKEVDRPIYFSFRGDIPQVEGFKARPEGLLFRMTKTTDAERRDYTPFWDKKREILAQKIRPFMKDLDLAVLAAYHEFFGLHYLENDMPEKAVSELDKAAEFSYLSPGGLNNLGSICAEHGMVKKALEYLTRALEVDSEYLQAHKNLAQLYTHLGENEKVLMHYKELARLDPENPQYQATIEGVEGKLETEKLFMRYLAEVEENPNSKVAHNNLGSAYAQRGKYDKAEEEYQKALMIDSEYGLARLNLKLLYERTGRKKKEEF